MQPSQLFSLALCTAMVFSTGAPAQDKKDQPKPAAEPTKKAPGAPTKVEPIKEPAPGAEEAAWIAAATPGEMHAWLKKGAGNWHTSVKTMMPGQPESVSKGSMTTIMILGDRYQHYQFKGELMGQPFEGAGTLGYNNVTGKFESTWMDNMSTGTMFGTGTLDKARKTMTIVAEYVDPMTKKPVSQREVTVWADDDHMTSEFFHKGPDGKEMKVMEIAFTREGAKPVQPAATKPAEPAKPAAPAPGGKAPVPPAPKPK